MTPYDAIKEREYMERTGEWERRKREDEDDQRRADERMRKINGEDYPGQYSR